MRSELAMTLTRLGGFDKLPVPVATSATFLQRDVEVGLALDVTGSMASYCRRQAQDRCVKERLRAHSPIAFFRTSPRATTRSASGWRPIRRASILAPTQARRRK